MTNIFCVSKIISSCFPTFLFECEQVFVRVLFDGVTKTTHNTSVSVRCLEQTCKKFKRFKSYLLYLINKIHHIKHDEKERGKYLKRKFLKFGWYLQLEECSRIWQSERIQIYSQSSQTPLTDCFTHKGSSEGNLKQHIAV